LPSFRLYYFLYMNFRTESDREMSEIKLINMPNDDGINVNGNVESIPNMKDPCQYTNCPAHVNHLGYEHNFCKKFEANQPDYCRKTLPGADLSPHISCNLPTNLTIFNLGIHENHSINENEEPMSLLSLKFDNHDDVKTLTDTLSKLELEINELKENQLEYQHEQERMDKYLKYNDEKMGLLTMEIDNLKKRKKCPDPINGRLEDFTGKQI